MKDKQLLPRFSDGNSFLYLEHCKVERDANAVAAYMEDAKIPVPCASLSTLMLGPGTNISHAAVKVLADNGCQVIWCGEQGVRFYAQGFPDTKSAANTLKQAFLQSIPELRLKVIRKMYTMRFFEDLPEGLTLQQIRGKEGARVRDNYAYWSRKTNIPWKGRNYKLNDWDISDNINKALSWANSCLYGVVQAGIVSLGYSPALGFINIGKQLSFVYDIADLYKTEITVPIAFTTVSEGPTKIEPVIRKRCREMFKEKRLLEQIVKDIDIIMSAADKDIPKLTEPLDGESMGMLWNGFANFTVGGRNWGDVDK